MHFSIFFFFIGMVIFYSIIFEDVEKVFAEISDTKFIDDELFFVSKPYIVQDEPNKIITFHGVNFTIPYTPNPPPPGGIRSTTITFPDGGVKKLSQGITPKPKAAFTQGFGLKAGFLRDSNSIFFLVSVNSEPPLKQLKFQIAPENISCKNNLELYFKYNNNPICIKESTFEKLLERGYLLYS